ncbi:MAG: type II toxin-antitoxin system VapC family toxin [Candidatus Sulfotelmatobacter sp.]
MNVYIDSSFLVSAYLEDIHSAAADELLRTQQSISLTPLHMAEWAHAVAQQVFRTRISLADAVQVEREFEADIHAGIWRQTPMPESVFTVCADLARRYGAKLGMRTLDTLHVACALELKADRFWTFDERQAKLAKAAGLKIA